MSDDRLHLDPEVLTAPMGVGRVVETLGRALWLYHALLLAANRHGTVVRTRMRFAKELSVPEETIDAWLERLVAADLVEQKSPSPYLVLTLRFWSGKRSTSKASSPESSGSSGLRTKEVPVSRQQQLPAADENNGDRGPGEGGALLAEARDLLGPGDTDEIADLISRHPAPVVRRAIHRVRITPAHQIRKSRLALFRYLLVKFSTPDRSHG